ncbi:MAG: hypothetical protein NC132_03770 [Corallococcus sp.]|nr:hypothetical protein [Corallococcus sp.]MCM1359618.1 hypothetical protein [Corallococcus sp.]MCM1395210.1 hypothetical protein [Corallococcus sp.]
MKKKIAIICCIAILAVGLLSVFAACGGSELNDENLKSLRSVLYNQYREDATEQAKSYKVMGTVTSFDSDGKEIKCNVLWTIEGSDKVTVSKDKDSNGNYTVNVPDQSTLTETVAYTLVGTLVNDKDEPYKGYNGDEDAVYQVKFNRTVSQLGGDNALLQHYLPDVVTSPAMNTEYNLSMYNGAQNYVYYFTGAMKDSKYFDTSDTLSNSKKVKLVEAAGGFYISFDDGGTTKYLTFTGRAGTSSTGKATPYADCSITTTPTTVFSLDASLNGALKTTVVCGDLGDNDFYLGGQSSYTTMSSSSSYYLTGSNAANVDGSQCVVRLIGDGDYNQYGGKTLDDNGAKFRQAVITNPVEGTSYKLAFYHGGKQSVQYIKGEIKNSYYLDSTNDLASSVDILIENGEGGFYLYFMSGETKNYISFHERTDKAGSGTTEITTTKPAGVYTINSDGVIVITTGSNTYCLADSSATYFTIGCKNVNVITNSGADVFVEVMDTTWWVVRLVPVEGVTL